MKKIKISELPLFSSLKGLFTIGTDDQNRSVKVPLEFIETDTKAAVSKAETSAANADRAATETRTATSACQTATNNAKTATAQANTARDSANTAATKATTSATKADEATAKANQAKAAADEATAKANQAKAAADEATVNAKTATASANEAAETAETSAANADRAAANAITVKVDIQEMLDRLIPTGLTVTAPLRLTLGNPKASVIAKLTPETALKNVIFISDDKAVEVDVLTGRLTTLVCGKSKVRIIPTTNVSLTKTLLIEVGEATLRLQTKSALRLTSGGALRMN